jgi:hypothetical protein
MLAGLEQPRLGHSLRRGPDGRVRSLRLAAKHQKDEARPPASPAAQPAAKRVQPRKPATTVPRISETGKVQKATSPRRRLTSRSVE